MEDLSEAYRLSPQQERAWRLQAMAGDPSVYHSRCAILVDGDLDLSVLRAAWRGVLERHGILRTTLRLLPGLKRPVQALNGGGVEWLDGTDLRGLDPEARQAAIESLFEALGRRRFDPVSGPTVYLCLARLADHRHVLLVSLPAHVADAVTLGNLVAELGRCYEAELGHRRLDDEPVQYYVVSEWLNDLLSSEEMEPGKRHWTRLDFSALPELCLPDELPAAGEPPAFCPRAFTLRMDADRLGRIEELGRRCESGLTPVLLAGWQALLSRLTGRERQIVAVGCDGRTDEELRASLGLFARYVPVSADLPPDLRFSELARRLAATLEEASQWQECFTWEGIELLVARHGGAPFFPFGFELLDAVQAVATATVSFALDSRVACLDRFKLRLCCVRRPDGLDLELHYDASFLERGTVALLGERLAVLLASAAADPDATLERLDIMSPAELERLLVGYNETAVELPPDCCLHQLFAEQAARTPDLPALVAESGSLTYAELESRANQLAHHLRRIGVGLEDVVGICLERSTDLVVGLLGILKAGAAYLPLDPEYPEDRLRFMLEDTAPRVMVTRAGVHDTLRAHVGHAIDLDGHAEAIGRERSDDPQGGASPENLAYVIYTSGSTGRPKGVMVRHRSIANCVLWSMRAFPIAEGCRLLQKTPCGFDASVWEFFVPLVSGACLVLARPHGHKDPTYLVRTVARERITDLQLVPSLLRMLLDEPELAACTSLRRVFCGGEALAGDLPERLFSLLDVELHNVYGPTEVSVDTNSWTCRRGEVHGVVPIGRPIANIQAFILDPAQRPVPAGVPGELYLGGEGLARGYRNRPELTAQRFVPHFAPGCPGERLYRTGDLARHRPDGGIDFLGRIDHQVKLRGFRIELGEIEASLRLHPEVQESVVVPRGDGGQRLVAYVVRGAGQEGPADEELPERLREFLASRLPEYMVPTVFVPLAELPRTPSGKLDRNALPEPEQTRRGLRVSYVAPRGPLEEKLADIWRELLGQRELGVLDNFFELGGHSLLATRLISRLREDLHTEVPLRTLFDAPTVAALAAQIEALGQSAPEIALPPLEQVPRDRPLPLSSAQQRLWLLDRLDPGTPAYNIPAAVRLGGRLNVAALAAAVAVVVRRHEALRTTFGEQEGEPVQVIAEAPATALPVVDLTALPASRRGAESTALLGAEALRPFDLTTGPLLRTSLVRLAAEEHIALLTMHHAVSDGWSAGLFIRELAACYNALDAGRPCDLPALSVQYADYAVWQRGWLQGEILERQLAFWRQRLAGAPDALDLPLDRPRPAVQGYAGDRRSLSLPLQVSQQARELGRLEGATQFMIFLAAFEALLGRYTGQLDLVVGTPVANRERLELEGIVGLFVNTLVLRTDLRGALSFREAVGRVRETLLAASAHQDLPFERLVEELQLGRDLSRSPIFQVMFSFEPLPAELRLGDLTLSPLEGQGGTAKFDLELVLWDEPGGTVRGILEYSTDLFEGTTIERMVEHLVTLTAGAVAHPGRRLADLPLLGAAERHQVTIEWNDSRERLYSEWPYHALFAAQAARTPEAPAVRCGERELSYRELDQASNRLARALVSRSVGDDTTVALLFPRGIDFLVAILAVLKAGGAYLPMDPEHPAARHRQVLEQGASPLLLAADELLGAAAAAVAGLTGEGRPRTAAFGELLAEDWSGEDLPARGLWEGLAYVIFTSGSTGVPKGAMLEHRGLVNHLFAMIRDLGLGAGDVMAQTAPQCFDISVWQFLTLLLVGGRIEILGDDVARDPRRLLTEVERTGVTVLQLVPSLMRILIEEIDLLGARRPCFERMRWLIPTGEALPPELCRAWAARYPAIPQINAYGPAECSDDVSLQRIREAPPEDILRIAIGRPVMNLSLWVLDADRNPVPLGAAGQLYVGGVGVGRGYLNDPRRTAESFLPDPFSQQPGRRLYQTGDLGRYRPTGELEFLGRIDHQVKVRGLRIDLEEIEAVLGRHPGIEAAVVVARGEGVGDHRIAAYVVARSAGAPSVMEIRSHLSERLPAYMVPADFVLLPALPLTPNGKVDRQALPEPPRDTSPAAVVPPSPVEELLAAIWAGLLKGRQAGPGDDFFALGGHSLLAAQVIVRIRDAFGVEISLRELFEHPTLGELAARIERALRSGAGVQVPPLRRAPRDGELPLSFAQQRLWFIDQLAPGNAAYNVFSGLFLHGPLDVVCLERAFNEILARHEVLRTELDAEAGRPVLRIMPEVGLHLSVVDLSALPEPWRKEEERRLALAEARWPFDLGRAPLLRVLLLRLTAGSHAGLFVTHHIVSDGWSMDVLIDEMMVLYSAFLEGQPSPLAPLAVQYLDYALWQREWLAGENREQLLAFWRRRLGGDLPALTLPTDRPRPEIPSGRGAVLPATLPAELSGVLNDFCRREGVTLFMALLAVFKVLLYRTTGQEDIVVGTDVANRSLAETERLIGFFVNHLVLRTDLGGNPTVRELLRRVREVSLDAFAHQEMPFDQLVAELRPERVLGQTPLFQVLFVFQNTPARPMALPRLRLEPLVLDEHQAKYDLTLFIEEAPHGLLATWRYRADLYEATTIRRLADRFRTLIERIVAEPEIRLRQLDILATAEKTEQTMQKQTLQMNQLDKLKKLKPRAVSLPEGDLVTTELPRSGAKLPLIVRPAVAGIDLGDWIKGNGQFVESRLAEHGALLFRGFAVDTIDVFERFASALCPDLFGEYGDLPREGRSEKVYHSTPYPEDKTILFHNESSHLHQWPTRQFFHCVIPAREGGETPIVDCREMIRRLDPEIVRRFREKKLMYVRNFVQGVDVGWQDFFRTEDRAEVEAYCRKAGIEFQWKGENDLMTRRVSPGVCRHPQTGEWTFFNQVQLHHVSCLDAEVRRSMEALFRAEDLPRNVCYGDGAAIEESVMEEIGRAYWEAAVALPWEAGDIMVLDNMLVAHARNPFVGPRKIVVAMGHMVTAEQVETI